MLPVSIAECILSASSGRGWPSLGSLVFCLFQQHGERVRGCWEKGLGFFSLSEVMTSSVAPDVFDKSRPSSIPGGSFTQLVTRLFPPRNKSRKTQISPPPRSIPHERAIIGVGFKEEHCRNPSRQERMSGLPSDFPSHQPPHLPPVQQFAQQSPYHAAAYGSVPVTPVNAFAPSRLPPPTSASESPARDAKTSTPDGERTKPKQKRNKPTLSCEECVERKTKVGCLSIFLAFIMVMHLMNIKTILHCLRKSAMTSSIC